MNKYQSKAFIESQAKTSIFAFLLIGLCVLLSGCSGPDDLRLTNNYAFDILLRSESETIGTVAAGETKTFFCAAGYRGDCLNEIKFFDKQGKKLGNLRTCIYGAKRHDSGRLNGSVTWNISIGLPPPQTNRFFPSKWLW